MSLEYEEHPLASSAEYSQNLRTVAVESFGPLPPPRCFDGFTSIMRRKCSNRRNIAVSAMYLCLFSHYRIMFCIHGSVGGVSA